MDEARWQLEDQPDASQAFIDMLAALHDHHARAMVAFLDHPECWKGATRFHYADSLTHWRKRKNRDAMRCGFLDKQAAPAPHPASGGS